MPIVVTNTGHRVDCDAAIPGERFPVLHIYTNKITPIEAYQIFGEEGALDEITVIDEESEVITNEDGESEIVNNEITKVYHGYTELFSVQKSSLIKNDKEILIWLQRPVEVV